MRILGLGTVLLVGWAGPVFAFDEPKALVSAIYEPFQKGQKPADLQQYYSANLKALFAHAGERDGVGPLANAEPVEAAPSFNPFVSDENYLLYDLVIGEPQVIEDRAAVTVRFHNFDHPSLLTLSLIKEADGWKVDDVASMGKDEHWLLSWLLTYDPLNN